MAGPTPTSMRILATRYGGRLEEESWHDRFTSSVRTAGGILVAEWKREEGRLTFTDAAFHGKTYTWQLWPNTWATLRTMWVDATRREDGNHG